MSATGTHVVVGARGALPHIPILRSGRCYESVEKIEIVHHVTRRPVARVSLANSGLIARDVRRMDDNVLESFTVRGLLEKCREAADLFMRATLRVGDIPQTFDDYIVQLSATTGMPIALCRNNAEKIRRMLAELETVVRGLTRGFDLDILDRGYGEHEGGMLSFYRAGRIFGAVLPSNSPGVHSLWIPAIALKAPIVLKPGREEPWTPLRIIQSMIAAGIPREAFGFYPTDHAGAGELIRSVDRSMLFGSGPTVEPWRNDSHVEIHGPGYSKILLGDDQADHWEEHLELMVSSIEANGGRSCINASAIWTPKHGRAIAEAIAERLSMRRALPANDENATLAAFTDSAMPEYISASINQGLLEPGAVDLVLEKRGTPRLATLGPCVYLLPTIIWCEHRDHALSNREFLFPYASVVSSPTAEMPVSIGPSLVVTALTKDSTFAETLMASPNVDRLNIGPIPTYRLSWDQPHEGNLFEHLYRQRAFQIEPAA